MLVLNCEKVGKVRKVIVIIIIIISVENGVGLVDFCVCILIILGEVGSVCLRDDMPLDVIVNLAMDSFLSICDLFLSHSNSNHYKHPLLFSPIPIQIIF